MLPTPRASGWNKDSNYEARKAAGKAHSPALEVVLRRLLPSPRAQAMTDERIECFLARKHAGKVSTPKLAVALKMRADMTGPVKLHPRFVEWMMGFPDGWTDYEL